MKENTYLIIDLCSKNNITDRSYFSENILEALILKNKRFIMIIKRDSNYVKKLKNKDSVIITLKNTTIKLKY